MFSIEYIRLNKEEHIKLFVAGNNKEHAEDLKKLFGGKYIIYLPNIYCPEEYEEKYINKNLIAKYAIPNIGLKLKVSTPYPNILYKYNNLRAFL